MKMSPPNWHSGFCVPQDLATAFALDRLMVAAASRELLVYAIKNSLSDNYVKNTDIQLGRLKLMIPRKLIHKQNS